MLDHERLIGEEAEALAVAGEAGDPDATVPGTDWTLAEVVDHVARLTWFWAGRTRKAGGGDFYDTEPPEGVTPTDFIRQGAVTMCEQLRLAAPDAEIKTFAGMRSPAWLLRRITQELAVHCWDAQAAGGAPQPIATEVADDGVDEFLEDFAPMADVSAVGGTIHLHSTDGDGEWFIETAAGLSWRRAHEKGDVAVRGTTSDLLLLLWGRVTPDQLEVLGDESVLTRWREVTRF